MLVVLDVGEDRLCGLMNATCEDCCGLVIGHAMSRYQTRWYHCGLIATGFAWCTGTSYGFLEVPRWRTTIRVPFENRGLLNDGFSATPRLMEGSQCLHKVDRTGFRPLILRLHKRQA